MTHLSLSTLNPPKQIKYKKKGQFQINNPESKRNKKKSKECFYYERE